MAEERFEGQEATGTSLWAWTELFRTFQVALDPRKLFLAAAGILVMAAGWYVIDTIFNGAWVEPKRSDAPYGAAALGKSYTEIPEDELRELKRRFPEASDSDLKNRWLQEIGDR